MPRLLEFHGALQDAPFIKAHPAWIAAIKQLLEMRVRAEQRALAKWGLNYVIEEYLPRKLADKNGFCRDLSYELSSRPKMDVGSNPAGSH